MKHKGFEYDKRKIKDISKGITKQKFKLRQDKTLIKPILNMSKVVAERKTFMKEFDLQ